MDFIEKTLHLFLPRASNNHKAKILHPSGLLVLASFFILFQAVLNFIPKLGPSILGYASQISPDEIIRLTNEKRAQAGLPSLTLNGTLSVAAQSKGNDMIIKDYWAHIAPDGTQPWSFFTSAGYRYRYAGENLARDFSSASSAVDAWMNSPTHRENILNSKYKEIGIGVVEGDLAGVDTTIIVQFFGSTYVDNIAQPVAANNPINDNPTIKPTIKPTIAATISPTSSPIPIIAIASPVSTVEAIFTTSKIQQFIISPFATTRAISLSVVGLLVVVFLVDSFFVSKKGIAIRLFARPRVCSHACRQSAKSPRSHSSIGGL